MELMRLDDLIEWREHYIRSGKAESFNDMTALAIFISNAERIQTRQVKYFDETEKVWTIGEML